MIRGCFRTTDRLLGRCVRVDEAAGDASPLLKESIYRDLGGTPPIEDLPVRGPVIQRIRERIASHCGEPVV